MTDQEAYDKACRLWGRGLVQVEVRIDALGRTPTYCVGSYRDEWAWDERGRGESWEAAFAQALQRPSRTKHL